MPASRARTAICSAPLEWPSRPGLPTRILTRRPSASLTCSTRSRSAASESSAAAAAASPTPVGARYSPKTSRSAAAHSPVVAPARAAASVAGMMFSSDDGSRAESLQRSVDRPWSRPSRHARSASIGGALHGRVDPQDAAVLALLQRRRLRLGERVLPDHGLLARLDSPHALAVRLDQLRLHVRHRLDRAAALGHHGHLLARALDQLGDEPVHDVGALEDVGVVEQVGLVGQDLLDPQRPLLVPRPRQPERLVPGRQLERARPRVAAHRHRERLEHDPDDVVLRLRLGQPERVHLHAVAEAQEALVVDAVALAADLLPQLAHRAQLRVLLDEPDARVDEERHAPEHARERSPPARARAPGRARPARWTARRRSPAPASRRPPGGGTSRC